MYVQEQSTRTPPPVYVEAIAVQRSHANAAGDGDWIATEHPENMMNTHRALLCLAVIYYQLPLLTPFRVTSLVQEKSCYCLHASVVLQYTSKQITLKYNEWLHNYNYTKYNKTFGIFCYSLGALGITGGIFSQMVSQVPLIFFRCTHGDLIDNINLIPLNLVMNKRSILEIHLLEGDGMIYTKIVKVQYKWP